MIIGHDLSVLYVARAGVYTYHYNMLKALVRLAPPEDSFVLLDYPAIHGHTFAPPDLGPIIGPRVAVRRLAGLRHRKLSRSPGLQRAALKPVAQSVDRLLNRPWGGLAQAILARQLSRHLADLDLFHMSDVFNFQIPGVKSVTTIHDLTALLFPEYHTSETIALQAEKLLFAREQADGIIADSQSTKQDLVRLLSIPPERIEVVPIGVDPGFRPLATAVVEPILSFYQLEPGGFFLYVGTIEPRKNLVRLVEAYAQIRPGLAPPVPRLVLAGGLGWKAEPVLARIEELGLTADVKLLGSIPYAELPSLYNGALLFVFPSLYEGFGLPPLEAMACGTPVITSNVSSLPEVVGEAGLLVDPTRTAELAEAMRRLATDAELRAVLRERGLSQAAQFTWDRAAVETLAVYRQVLSDR